MKPTTASVCEVTGKISYRDRIAALLALSSCRHNRRARMEHRAYRCPCCGNWHLTKKH